MANQDAGWAWAVAFASFISHCLLAALYYASGVFTLSWKEDFQASAAMASLVGSTSGGFTSIAAPLGSYIINRWGCRTAHMVGGLLVTLGTLLASQASSLVMIFVCYGVIGGTGLGLCYVPAVIVLSKYFKRKRGLAIGIASSGIGVGSFIFPILLEYLQNLYTWRGAMLILSGIMLNNCVCAVTMFPILDQKTKCTKTDNKQTSEELDDEVTTTEVESKDKKAFNCETIYESKEFIPEAIVERKQSLQVWRNFKRHPWLRRKSSLGEFNKAPKSSVQSADESSIKSNNPITESLISLFSVSQMTFLSQTFQLLKNPYFYLMIINNLTMFVGMMTVYGLTPLRVVEDLNLTSEEGAFLVSVIGISNLIGRFSWGALSNLIPYKNTPIILFLILRVISAVLTLFSTLATTYKLQLIYCSTIGLGFGSWSLYPLVLAEMFGDRQLNAAFGYLEIFDGVGSIVGPTIGGYIYDVTGHYSTSFVLSGSTLAVGTFVVGAGYFVVKRYKNKIEIPNRDAIL